MVIGVTGRAANLRTVGSVYGSDPGSGVGLKSTGDVHSNLIIGAQSTTAGTADNDSTGLQLTEAGGTFRNNIITGGGMGVSVWRKDPSWDPDVFENNALLIRKRRVGFACARGPPANIDNSACICYLASMPAEAKTTLYLRGVPRAVVREAKAAAAREGVTLAQWVTARLGGPSPAPDSAGAGAVELSADLAFYEEQRAELERKYPDEYVAIVERRVVDHDASFEALGGRVFRKYGGRPVCMPRVGRSVVQVRSPRRVAG